MHRGSGFFVRAAVAPFLVDESDKNNQPRFPKFSNKLPECHEALHDNGRHETKQARAEMSLESISAASSEAKNLTGWLRTVSNQPF